MTGGLRLIPLRWRIFLATSTLVTVLFGVAGWSLERYALQVAARSVQDEMQASIHAYEAIWKTKTDSLATSTALMSAMSDVRAAFMTRDRETIRDSAQELWSRVSNQPALFQVLDPEGHLISSLGSEGGDLSLASLPFAQLRRQFPKQLAGYVPQASKLFYVVLTPVYVQGSQGSILLNVLCAGFRIGSGVVQELRSLAPGSDFAFVARDEVFASTLGANFTKRLLENKDSDGKRFWDDRFVVSSQQLNDIGGQPVAELRILHSYEGAQAALVNLRNLLALAWLVTIAAALTISSYFTSRLLAPIKALDRAAAAVAAGDYTVRLPQGGRDELGRLAKTFNQMCESIQRAQAELIRNEQIQTIGRLATSLVHDLRNPLAAIYGGAEMLIDGQLPPTHEHRIALSIYRASQRMQEMLRDLLNISRGRTHQPEVCRLREILEAAAEAAPQNAGPVAVTIEIDDDALILADRTRIERVFSNLLSNAVEAMPDGGDVRIGAKQSDQWTDVLIEDSGTGVVSDVRGRLFQPFATGKRAGLGLGLTLSRQTMLELNGDLFLVSSGPEGTCFCVRFPAIALRRETGLHETRPASQ
ncbi:MAG: HAMP domain-containing histidine kinase [Acidobacteriota bacterium]|nr:HAMP domain-containing histidine kinase [Acidobacteriota bacterium]